MGDEDEGEFEYESEDEGKPITAEAIHTLCQKHQLYTVPELNEVLYLHYQMFTRIDALDPYVNVTSLWLNNNALRRMENLSKLKQLACLYLQGNLIETISGLDGLSNLSTLSLSNNLIVRIEGLETLESLHTLEVDHNRIGIAGLDGLTRLHPKARLGVLNLSHNRVDDESFVKVIKQISGLGVLKMDGNPVARTMSQYRRRIISGLTRNDDGGLQCQLTYLDEMPVNAKDVRLAWAWQDGGAAAEAREREAIRDEKDAEAKRHRHALREANRRFAQEHGEDTVDILSSDDEAAAENEPEPLLSTHMRADEGGLGVE